MEFELIKTSKKAIDGSSYMEKETLRLFNLYNYEAKWIDNGYQCIAGIDEAGRGPLAGPVVAACVIMPPNLVIEGVNDSKKLSPIKRDLLYDFIIKNCLDYSVSVIDNNVIDEINILQATKMAMKNCVNTLNIIPEVILVDAVKIEAIDIPQEAIVKGDALSHSIAASSIIAKVTRDRIIDKYGELYPQYEFSKHKGYGTALHIEKIKEFGLCPIHRVTFTKNFV